MLEIALAAQKLGQNFGDPTYAPKSSFHSLILGKNKVLPCRFSYRFLNEALAGRIFDQ